MKEQAHKDGYYLARGLLKDWFFQEVEDGLARTKLGHKTAIASFRQHPCVTELARELCGPDLADTNEAVVHHNPTRIYDQWHYDYPFETDRVVPLWRFAIYFRDYTQSSGALAVSVGSHIGKIADLDFRPHVIQSQPGDVVIWNLRTLHKPNAYVEGLPYSSPRNVIIFDYAAPSPELDKYIAWRLPKRQKEGRA